MAQDRGDDRADVVVGAAVQALQRAARALWRRRGDEVAPQLGHEEARMQSVADGEVGGVAPVVAPAPAVDALRAAVVELAVEAEVGHADAVAPVRAPAGQRPRHLAHVALGVAAARAQREQLLQLPRVVLVRLPAVVRGPVEPRQHRRVLRDVAHQAAEVAERVAAQERVLAQHPARVDAGLARREPVVPDERHPLHERRLGADHAVQPPQDVMAPDVARREPAAVDPGRRALEPPRPRVGEGVHRLVEVELGQPLGLAGTGAEPGAPQQPLGLGTAERPAVDGQAGAGAALGTGAMPGHRVDPGHRPGSRQG
jgi:hypothetical protein